MKVKTLIELEVNIPNEEIIPEKFEEEKNNDFALTKADVIKEIKKIWDDDYSVRIVSFEYEE